MPIYSGKCEQFPYSLSRWTDIAGSKSKWTWFKSCLADQQMVAFDPKTATPKVWSLVPEDTLGLVFWTKNSRTLIQNKRLLEPYKVVVNLTITGWFEAEEGVPNFYKAGKLLTDTSETFKTYWRFSPIPLLPIEILLFRFQHLLAYASLAKLNQVLVSFIQPNDKVQETRSLQERFDILNMLAEKAEKVGIKVVLCADDVSFKGYKGAIFETSPCVYSTDFDYTVKMEKCGCVSMVDPFTVNEACEYNCDYCYSGYKNFSKEKRDTTQTRCSAVL
jgi:hypothetical protein